MTQRVALMRRWAVSCRQVSKDFGDGESRTPVLRGVDFDARCGELTLLVGPSGCGKTTLLSVLTGLLDATDGHVSVFGNDIRRLRGVDAVLFRRKNLGFVFQQYNLLPSLTAVENAAVPLLAAGMTRRAAMAKASELLIELGLASRLSTRPAQLSGGEQQRVALARAFVVQPALLLADEPTGSLDFATGEQVMRLMFDLNRELGTTLVLVTHDRGIAARCERRITIEAGRVALNEKVALAPA